MLSNLKRFFSLSIWHPHLLRYMPISLKLAAVYSVMFCVILSITLSATVVGIHYVLYREAEVSILLSADYVVKKSGEMSMPALIRSVEKSSLIPGVVMRITDDRGNIIYDSMPKYLSISRVQENMKRQSEDPDWGDHIRKTLLPPDLHFVNFKNFWIFYTQRTVSAEGKTYTLHFMRTITAEKVFLEELSETIFYAGLAGVIISIICGFFLSRRLLRPLRRITATAKSIEIKDLSQRLQVEPTRDEIEELATTFNSMLERLQKGFEQQRRFVSDASHELRTPATVICGYSDMLSRWGKDDPQVMDECITAIHSEAINMQRLIEKLLFLARADQKRQVLHKERFSLRPLIADVTKNTQMVAPQHTVTCLANDDGFIFADELTIKQMLRIFLENSIKYTPDGGKITISSRRIGDFMEVELSDNGIGIAKEQQSKVFERFYRVDSARTKNETGGTGLGLSIAKWIANAHNIKIEMQSALGKGTTIRLKIPVDCG